MKYILVLITAALLGACNPPENSNAPPFRAAVEAHLAALSARDMEALSSTLTDKDSLLIIDSAGDRTETRQQYIDSQRQWLALNIDRRFEAEILDVVELAAFGHALVEYRFSPQNAADEMYTQKSWSTLTFDLENGSWRLSMRSDTPDDPRKKKLSGFN
jgi:hypothetical protein